MPSITLPKYLLTWTCISLRILIVTSFYNLVVFLTSPDHKAWELKSLLPFVILVHHFLSVWYLWFNLVFLDWLLTFGEFIAWFALQFYTWRMDRWSMSKYTVLLGSLYVQMLALMSLLFIRSYMIYRASSGLASFFKGLASPLNLLALDYNGEDPRKNKDTWKERLQLIFGRSLWKPTGRKGKHGIFIGFRAFVALSIFLGMLVFAIFCLIIWPVSETGMVPVKTMISPSVRWDFQSLRPGWNVFVILDRDFNASVVDALERDFNNINSTGNASDPNFNASSAITVTPLWEDLGQKVELCAPSSEDHLCKPKGHVFSDDLDHSLTYNTPTNVAVHSFHYFCPNRCTRDLNLFEFLKVPPRDTMPDLLMTINFKTLGITPLSSTNGGSRMKTVGVIVAFIDNISDVLRVSTQTSLLPGMHLMGRVGLEFRSLIALSYLAAFGLASPTHTFVAGTVYDLTQDPAPPTWQDTSTTASLRLYVPSDRTDWRFIEEDRERSVLAGFAAIGGLWTSVTGVFSFFFGGTLALLLWGQKPLSIFGLFDKPWRETLQNEWKDRHRPEGQGPQDSDRTSGASDSLNNNANRIDVEHGPNLNAADGNIANGNVANGNDGNGDNDNKPDEDIEMVDRQQPGLNPEPPLNSTEPPQREDANVNGMDENDRIMIRLLREKLVDLGPLENDS